MRNVAEKTPSHVSIATSSTITNSREKKQSLTSGRLVRIAIGVSVIGLALWTFAPSMLYPISSNAIVNAQVVTIRAPIQGEVTNILSADGEIIREGSLVASVKDRRIDRSKLAALDADLATLHETKLMLEQEIEELNGFLMRLADNSKVYHQSVNEHYQVLKEEKAAKLAAQQAIAKNTRSKLARQSSLFNKGLTTRAELDVALRDFNVARAELTTIELEIERVNVELESAKKGIYFGDGFNNVPYSQQRSDEIALRKQAVMSKLRDTSIRIRELERQINIEEQRLTITGGAELFAPSNGRVWVRLVNEGEHVTAGAPMIQIADLSRLFLIVILDERYFEDVRAGDTASIDLMGSPGYFSGTVERVQGSKAQLPESMLAVAQPTINKDEFIVFVNLDTSSFKDDSEIFNQVGRRAKVTFHKKNDPLSVKNQLTLLLDSLRQVGSG